MKKTLKDQARQAEQKILEDNKDFYNNITHKYFSEKPTLKRNLIKASSIVTACLLVVAFLSIALYAVFKEEPEYLLQNEVTIDSDINELNNVVPWCPINNIDEFIYRVTRTYDSISGDNLYFKLKINIESFSEKAVIYLFVNSKYKSNKELTDIKSIKINGIDINYEEKFFIDSDEKNNFNINALFKKNGIEIYIEYNQIWYENDTHFFEFLKNIIQ